MLPQNYGLPESLTKLIDTSVQNFEDQWGLMKNFAKQNGWLEKYRKEVTDLVKKAYLEGQNVKASDQPGN